MEILIEILKSFRVYNKIIVKRYIRITDHSNASISILLNILNKYVIITMY